MIFARATNNLKKLAEIQRILDSMGHEVKTLKQLGLDVDAEENGKTFRENAIIKAKAVAYRSGMPAISDDSGLEVDALKGRPGVYTARYASEHGERPTDDENIDKLLRELQGVEKDKRGARFVSSVCLYIPGNGEKEDFYVCETGTCEGWIGFERIGEDGFGYDPVFMVGDRSYAQMTAEEKDKISHRGRALALLEKDIKQLGL